ncbi:hypothetical protein CBM2609_P30021 [Cupriavidus taiwanensis]|nr:hypothetical protein CBM2588_P30024 [Cupriavidus taiwanensis]SOY99934.1 hypothetical protein CBM2591_P30026 [Cupriavidus taiwanensis]SOZ02374.1 hypothetical protein CBM2600_P30025 [Cupriavidus taiwanensis]SOZ34002.1 hypothetical protein CBM2609_P30021 [Cupriavidus taiwanensis]
MAITGPRRTRPFRWTVRTAMPKSSPARIASATANGSSSISTGKRFGRAMPCMPRPFRLGACLQGQSADGGLSDWLRPQPAGLSTKHNTPAHSKKTPIWRYVKLALLVKQAEPPASVCRILFPDFAEFCAWPHGPG